MESCIQRFTRLCLGMALTLPTTSLVSGDDDHPDRELRIALTVTSPLPYPNTPLDPTIDFSEMIDQTQATGILDIHSLRVINSTTNEIVPHALSSDFAYGDKGQVEFVVINPSHTEYEILFSTTEKRHLSKSRITTPQIGHGDLLRFDPSRPGPIAVPYSPGLHDLNGDGELDLVGVWNYAYRPGTPWNGVICFPRLNSDSLLFGELTHLRYNDATSGTPRFFSQIYISADFADLNRDGLLDLVIAARGTKKASLYINTGIREVGGMPRFKPAGSIAVNAWEACRVVDLDLDGVLDLVVDGVYIRNTNPQGWPFRSANPVRLNAGKHPCFLDIDGDNRLDAISLQGGTSVQPDFYSLEWRRNLGGTPPTFRDAEILPEVNSPNISALSVWHDAKQSGLIVQHNAFQQLSFFELVRSDSARTRKLLRRVGRAESPSAVMSLSDQAWPCLRDWDDDGDIDLIVGGGYGWPRVLINTGRRDQPAFQEPKNILSEGKPIRLVRNEILGKPHNWHDMGYTYPDYVDWDGDGLRDLICPNETNRIVWFRNTGTHVSPRFGPRQQIVCDEFPDSQQLRALSAARASDPKSNNGVYPYEKERPFMWRTGAALADFNGDDLIDIVTHAGHKPVATLFTQYQHEDGTYHLRRTGPLELVNGDPISDAIVNRRSHWTESFRAIDWNRNGRWDLIYSVAGSHNGTKDGGSIYLLRNVGTKKVPLFAEPTTMRCFGEPIRITNHGPHPWPGDFNGDGLPDLIACVEWSVYPYYSHAALMMDRRPEFTLKLRN